MKFILQPKHDFIQLNQLLKLLNLVETGGEANQVISEGYVIVNNNKETQKRKKLYQGDVIEFDGQTIIIEATDSE